MSLLGIDLGTSSIKCVLTDPPGRVQAVAQREYAIDTPHPGWAEQDPQAWWQACTEATSEAVTGAADEVEAVSFSGQMHGTVLLDAEGRPLRPAIIWADQRSAHQCEQIYEIVGRDQLAAVTCNPVAAGFMAASLMWLKEHESDTLAQTWRVLLPKDYVRYRLCGAIGSEPSDAVSTLLFDTRRRQWADAIIDALGLPQAAFPAITPSHAVVGEVTSEAAEETGLRAGTPVVAGGGDQPAAAIANGAIAPGTLLSTIGTGGQLLTPASTPTYDVALRTHTFCHVVPDRWFLMGATLSAGLSLRWLRDRVLGGKERLDYDQLSASAADVPAGAEGLIFLPYLVGERTPHLDPLARGCFVGLTLRHGVGHLARAVMEGVAFAMRDSLQIFRELGLSFDRVIASGGGARSALWRQIQADVYGLPVATVNVEEQAGVGAAMLAGVGIGTYRDFADAIEKVVEVTPRAKPDRERAALYSERHGVFDGLYPKLKETFQAL